MTSLAELIKPIPHGFETIKMMRQGAAPVLTPSRVKRRLLCRKPREKNAFFSKHSKTPKYFARLRRFHPKAHVKNAKKTETLVKYQKKIAAYGSVRSACDTQLPRIDLPKTNPKPIRAAPPTTRPCRDLGNSTKKFWSRMKRAGSAIAQP